MFVVVVFLFKLKYHACLVNSTRFLRQGMPSMCLAMWETQCTSDDDMEEMPLDQL